MCRKLLKEVGVCFMFAQKYHTSMKYVGAIRRELGFRTVFNILGPLTNPAKPEFFMLGVYDEYLCEPVAKVLSSMGVRHALVVYGRDKMDEVSPSCETTVCELRDGFYRTIVIKPEDFGMTRGEKSEIVGTGGDNARTFNISTTSAMIAAAAGVKVAKHKEKRSVAQRRLRDLRGK